MAESETEKRPDGEGAPPAESPAAGAPSASKTKAASKPALASAEPEVAPERPASVPAAKVPSEPPAAPAKAFPASSGLGARASRPGSSPSALPPPKDGTPLGAYEAVARSARLSDLVAIAQKVLTDAATMRFSEWSQAAKVNAAAEEAKVTRTDADTPYGNVLDVLGRGPEGDAERSLACALAAHAVAESERKDEHRIAGDVLWLSTHTPFDSTSLLDRALGDDAAEIWSAIGDRVRRIDSGKGASLGRGEAIIGAAALMSSPSPAAKKAVTELAAHVKDPTLAKLLTGESTAAAATNSGDVEIDGEMVAAPRGLVVTTILAFTGILFAMHAVRFIARLALAYKRPTEISLSSTGIRVHTRTELLGRVLRENEHVIPKGGLVRVVREVRYPRAAFYAGLLALALGSYIGVRAFVDGLRAASPSLLATGLVIVAIGIAADFVLGSVLPGSRGRVRLQLVPRKGATICVADIDAKSADAALARTLKA